MFMRTRLLLGAVALLAVCATYAQELALGGLEFRRQSEVLTPEDKNYNVLIGNLGLELWYVGGLEWDDNVNLASGVDPFKEEEVWLLKNGIKVIADFPVSPFLRLSGDLFLEWLWAIDGKHKDGIFLSSADLFDDQYAEIAVDLLMTDLHLLTVYDKIKRSSNLLDLDVHSPSKGVAYWENILGVQYEWQLTPLMELGLGYQYMSVWSDTKDFSFIDRTEHIYNITGSLQANRDWKINPFYTHRNVNFDHSYTAGDQGHHKFKGNNDAEEDAVGIKTEYQLTPTIIATATLGYEWLKFDVHHRSRADDDSTDGVFGGVGLAMEVTPNFRHMIDFSVDRQVNLSAESNYAIVYTTGYGLSWHFAPAWVLQSRIQWQHRNESDKSYGETTGIRYGGENAGNLYQEEVVLNYLLNPKTTIAVWYRRADRFSDLPIREYSQNRAGLQWIYQF